MNNSYKKYVKATQDIQINHAGEMYIFAENETQLVEFESSFYYNIMLRDMPLVPSTEEEYNNYEIPVIEPPILLPLSNLNNNEETNPPCDDGDHDPNRTQLDNTENLVSENLEGVGINIQTTDLTQESTQEILVPEAGTEELSKELSEPEETPEEGFIFPICNQVYGTQRGLNMHISKKHVGGK